MKTDRFTKMVEQVQERWRGTSLGTRHLVPSHKAVALLRRQFAQMRRVVVAQRLQEAQGLNNMHYKDACTDILVALDNYKRGNK